tara:strand:- start:35615 stop:35728 length:114 start_codon:yes stop_codon:yes gene_type:complete
MILTEVIIKTALQRLVINPLQIYYGEKINLIYRIKLG